jgi:hypothetical protein
MASESVKNLFVFMVNFSFWVNPCSLIFLPEIQMKVVNFCSLLHRTLNFNTRRTLQKPFLFPVSEQWRIFNLTGFL